jgi:hypothetical protein
MGRAAHKNLVISPVMLYNVGREYQFSAEAPRKLDIERSFKKGRREESHGFGKRH